MNLTIVNDYNKTELLWGYKGNCTEFSSYIASHLVMYRNQWPIFIFA